MFYSPKKDKKGLITSAALLALFSVMNVTSPLFEYYRGAVSAVSLVFLVLSLFVLIRFCVSKYAYEITSDSFVITKSTGQKSARVASLLLSTAYGVVKTPKTKEEREAFVARFGAVDVKMGCYTNLFAKTHLYVTEFNGKTYAFAIEIDEAFAARLGDAIEASRRRTDENVL